MTALQKVNLGTAPAGSDGDAVRAAFVKDNANVDVLNAQACLTSAALITTAQALTTAHIGKRVNINLSTAGTINLPSASTCAVDQVTLLRNTGTTIVTLAIATGSGDTVSVSKLNPGETALMDTDGVHTWACLVRGRTNSDNETVNGNCAVVGNETVGGTLGVTGAATLASVGVTGNATVGGTLGVTGAATFSSRPAFATKTPWDNGNLVNPVRSSTNTTNIISLDWQRNTTNQTALYVDSVSMGDVVTTGGAAQNITSVKNFNGNGQGYNSSPINIISTLGQAAIGFTTTGNGAIFRSNTGSTPAFEAMNSNASGYVNLICNALTQTSDRDLKTDVVQLREVLPLLRTKRLVNYRMKVPTVDGGGVGAVNIGVIAQEWQADFPELVIETGAYIDEDGDFIAHQYDPETGEEIFGPGGKPVSRKALGFNYSSASAVALQGVIELQEKLDAALARIAALEGKQ